MHLGLDLHNWSIAQSKRFCDLFSIVLFRGGSTWKPAVVPTGTFTKPSPSINNVSAVTKTSLAATKGENIGAIGTGHNLSARPFAPQVSTGFFSVFLCSLVFSSFKLECT